LTTFEHVFLKLDTFFFCRKVLDDVFNLLGGESVAITAKG